jgi:trans-2-enoyl-CoA reductase
MVEEINEKNGGIKLGFNCVGGEPTTAMARHLGYGGTLVTYGGMSKKHLTLPFDLLTHKGLSLKGFWIADWYAKHSKEERKELYMTILNRWNEGSYRAFYQEVDLDDFSYALEKSVEPFQFRKIILNCNYPDRFKEHDEKDEKDYWVFDTTTI